MLGDVLSAENIILDLDAKSKHEVMKIMFKRLCVSHSLGDASDAIFDALFERECMHHTAVSKDLAIPHARIDCEGLLCVCFSRLVQPVIWCDSDPNMPVSLVFMIIGSRSMNTDYLHILSDLSKLMKRKYFRECLLSSHSPEDIISTVQLCKSRIHKRP